MKENWLALYLCLLEDISVDKSLLVFNLRKMKSHSKYSEDLINNVYNLKANGATYKEISSELNIKKSMVQYLLKLKKFNRVIEQSATLEVK